MYCRARSDTTPPQAGPHECLTAKKAKRKRKMNESNTSNLLLGRYGHLNRPRAQELGLVRNGGRRAACMIPVPFPSNNHFVAPYLEAERIQPTAARDSKACSLFPQT